MVSTRFWWDSLHSAHPTSVPSRETRPANVTLILSIPIEVRLAILFVLGCCVGAAINLGIYRLAWFPRPIGPWSRPHRKAPPRRFWDRVPVIGWLGMRTGSQIARRRLLDSADVAGTACRGRVRASVLVGGCPIAAWCRQHSHARRHPRSGNIALPAIRHEQFVAHVVLFCFMLVAFWIDVDEMTIPDGVTIPGTLAGLVI